MSHHFQWGGKLLCVVVLQYEGYCEAGIMVGIILTPECPEPKVYELERAVGIEPTLPGWKMREAEVRSYGISAFSASALCASA